MTTLEQYREWRQPQVSKPSLDLYIHLVRGFLKFVNKPVSNITQDDINAWQASIRDQAFKTRFGKTREVRAFLKWAKVDVDVPCPVCCFLAVIVP